MRQVLSVRKTGSLPSWKQWKQISRVLHRWEKRLLSGASLVIVLSLLVLLVGYVTAHRIDIPAVGGEYTEGLIGEPQFINPLYSISSDVDHDLVSLIYSGLIRWDQEDGFIPDLAESIQINEDATVYTFKIREGAQFHNGEDVRVRDVLFTINAIQNTSYRSPLADQFYNVTVVQEDDRTVSFILEESSVVFLQYLTVGILPATLWADILPQNAPLAALNLQPVGSGPYRFAEFAKDKKGSIRSYTLERNDDYYLNPPYIERLTFKFYPDIFALHEGLINKNIEGASVVGFDQLSAINENKTVDLLEPFLPKVTALYFNQDLNESLKTLEVRQAILHAIDKSALVSDVYEERARVIHTPILPDTLGYTSTLVDLYDPTVTLPESENEDPIHLNLTTIDTPDLRLVAEQIEKDLEKIGLDIETHVVSAELIQTEVITPRNFELLLAPILMEADPDPYPYWHSTQTKGAGLNLAGYSNKEVDALLETARTETDTATRTQKYIEFQTLLAQDVPAVFLYQSRYGYAIPKKIHHPDLNQIVQPSDRFMDITSWYIKTKKALR